ncbi:MAG: DnaJ family domain-containing protein [bacterium]|nr:DnaJ family domain-containing protein [bacterium]
MSDRWESAIDRAIREAMEKKEFENLSGYGKPLNLNDDSNVPEDKRMAFKILSDNEMAPQWIMAGKDLAAAEAELLRRIERTVKNQQKAEADAERVAPHLVETYRHNARALWKKTQAALEKAVEDYNRRVTSYNLQVPPGVEHRKVMRLERELQRWMHP